MITANVHEIKPMRGTLRKLTVASLCAALLPCLSGAADFYWQGNVTDWSRWDELSKWSQDKSGSIAADHVPGTDSDDRLWPMPISGSGKQVGKFDLGGGSFTLAGWTAGDGTVNGAFWVDVTNGTLSIANAMKLGQYTTVSWRLHDSAALNYCAAGEYDINSTPEAERYSIGGNGYVETWDIRSGSAMNVYNFFALRALNATVEPGGSLTLDEGRFRLSNKAKAAVVNTIVNRGTVKLPNGLEWTDGDPWSSASLQKQFVLTQETGAKLEIGGDFVKSSEENNGYAAAMRFVANGGLISVEPGRSVSFSNATTRCGQETFAEVGANAFVEVRVPAESSLDMTLFSYGAGAALTKTGEGSLTLKRYPSSLDVRGGLVTFKGAITGDSSVSFADGCTVVLAAAGNVIDVPPSNFRNIRFSVDCTGFIPGSLILSSKDAEFLEHVCDQVKDLAPSGMLMEIVNGAIRLRSDKAFVFDGEKDLSDADAWGGTVPVGGAALVSGESTVALITSSTPAFSSITLEGGATLKVVGSGIAIPKVTLTYPSRLLIPEGTACTLSVDALESKGDASGLPVFEIASGATVTAERNLVLKNVDFRLYGTIKTPKDGTGGITFGGSGIAEHAYFAMTAVGGTIDIYGSTTEAWKQFVTPAGNGSVTVVGPILLKDTTVVFRRNDGSEPAYNGVSIGTGNPEDRPFEFILDNTVMPLVRKNMISGAAKVICRNGGGLWKPTAHPGVAATMYVQGWSSIELIGADAHLGYSYAADRDPFYVNPWLDTTPASITVRDGAWVAFHSTAGGNHGAFVSSNGVWRVPTLPFFSDKPVPPDNDARNWLSDLFNGFKSIVIDGESSLFIESWAGMFGDIVGEDWDRNVALADVPMTGAGDLVLTNGTPGRSFTAVMTSGKNTATGKLRVADSEDPTSFMFDDGANWAGTVMGDEHISFTNRTDASKPATVDFSRLELTGKMKVRVWRGEPRTNDMVNLAFPIGGNGQIVPVFTDGKDPVDGDVVSLGTYPADSPLPDDALAGRNWRFQFADSDDSGKRVLQLRYRLPGLFVIIR